jgi:predicted phage-related endonuclease
MSVEIEHRVVDFDDNTASWVDQYKSCLAKIKEWQESADIARANIEASMGDAQLATYKGQPVIRWTMVTTKRFDVKRAKELLPDELVEKLQTESESRRFTVVSEDSE